MGKDGSSYRSCSWMRAATAWKHNFTFSSPWRKGSLRIRNLLNRPLIDSCLALASLFPRSVSHLQGTSGVMKYIGPP